MEPPFSLGIYSPHSHGTWETWPHLCFNHISLGEVGWGQLQIIKERRILQFCCSLERTYHTKLRGSIEVLLEVERRGRNVVSMGRNGENRGGCLKIGHLHLKVALMKFMFTVIAKIHYLGLIQMVKNLPTMQETQVWSLGWEDPLERWMATHSSIPTWKFHG